MLCSLSNETVLLSKVFFGVSSSDVSSSDDTSEYSLSSESISSSSVSVSTPSKALEILDHMNPLTIVSGLLVK